MGASIEQDAWNTGAGGTIVSTFARTGTYSYRVLHPTASANLRYSFAATNQTASFFFRFYIYIAALPGTTLMLSQIADQGSIAKIVIRLTSTGTLQLYNQEDTAQVGSDSEPLLLNRWYCIEVNVDSTTIASTVTSARIDGTQFASGTVNLTSGIARFLLGNTTTTDSTLDIYYDDIAINNTSGSFQNSWPGPGSIVHLKPNATGDSNGFTVGVGGTAGAANNFTRVQEVTPDDATTYNAVSVLNATDLFNVDDSGIGFRDTVNVVAIGGRFADLVGADATAAFKFELEKTGSGTKSQSAAIIPNSTTWKTNGTASLNYPLVTYQDPDGANWTKTTLDSMQVGYIVTATNVQSIAVSTVWASVDYTPATHTLSALGAGS